MKDYLRLFLMADGGNDGGDPPKDEPPKDTPPADQPKTFTQEEVNAINAKTKNAERAALLKELGIEGDTKSAKEALKAFKEQEDAKKSEVEKLKESLKAEQEGKATLAQERDLAKAELSAIKKGCLPDKSDKLVKLAMTYEGETIDAKIEAALKDFPAFKETDKKPLDKFGNPVKNEGGSDLEALLKKELMKG